MRRLPHAAARSAADDDAEEEGAALLAAHAKDARSIDNPDVIKLNNACLKLLLALLVGMYWSRTPDTFDVKARAAAYAAEDGGQLVTGSATTSSIVPVTPSGKWPPSSN